MVDQPVSGEIAIRIETVEGSSPVGPGMGGTPPGGVVPGGGDDRVDTKKKGTDIWAAVTRFLPIIGGAFGIVELVRQSKIMSTTLSTISELSSATIDLLLSPLLPLLVGAVKSMAEAVGLFQVFTTAGPIAALKYDLEKDREFWRDYLFVTKPEDKAKAKDVEEFVRKTEPFSMVSDFFKSLWGTVTGKAKPPKTQDMPLDYAELWSHYQQERADRASRSSVPRAGMFRVGAAPLQEAMAGAYGAETQLSVNTIIQVMGPGVIDAAALESIRRHAKEGARKSVDDFWWERIP